MKKLFSAILTVMLVMMSAVPTFASTADVPQSNSDQADSEVYQVSETSRTVHVSPAVTETYITRTFSNGTQVTDLLRVTRELTRAGLIRINPEYTYYMTKSDGSTAGHVTIYGTFTYDGTKASCVSKYYQSTVDYGRFTSQILNLKNGTTSGQKVTIAYEGVVLQGRQNKYVRVTLSCDRNGKVGHTGSQSYK